MTTSVKQRGTYTSRSSRPGGETRVEHLHVTLQELQGHGDAGAELAAPSLPSYLLDSQSPPRGISLCVEALLLFQQELSTSIAARIALNRDMKGPYARLMQQVDVWSEFPRNLCRYEAAVNRLAWLGSTAPETMTYTLLFWSQSCQVFLSTCRRSVPPWLLETWKRVSFEEFYHSLSVGHLLDFEASFLEILVDGVIADVLNAMFAYAGKQMDRGDGAEGAGGRQGGDSNSGIARLRSMIRRRQQGREGEGEVMVQRSGIATRNQFHKFFNRLCIDMVCRHYSPTKSHYDGLMHFRASVCSGWSCALGESSKSSLHEITTAMGELLDERYSEFLIPIAMSCRYVRWRNNSSEEVLVFRQFLRMIFSVFDALQPKAPTAGPYLVEFIDILTSILERVSCTKQDTRPDLFHLYNTEIKDIIDRAMTWSSSRSDELSRPALRLLSTIFARCPPSALVHSASFLDTKVLPLIKYSDDRFSRCCECLTILLRGSFVPSHYGWLPSMVMDTVRAKTEVDRYTRRSVRLPRHVERSWMCWLGEADGDIAVVNHDMGRRFASMARREESISTRHARVVSICETVYFGRPVRIQMRHVAALVELFVHCASQNFEYMRSKVIPEMLRDDYVEWRLVAAKVCRTILSPNSGFVPSLLLVLERQKNDMRAGKSKQKDPVDKVFLRQVAHFRGDICALMADSAEYCSHYTSRIQQTTVVPPRMEKWCGTATTGAGGGSGGGSGGSTSTTDGQAGHWTTDADACTVSNIEDRDDIAYRMQMLFHSNSKMTAHFLEQWGSDLASVGRHGIRASGRGRETSSNNHHRHSRAGGSVVFQDAAGDHNRANEASTASIYNKWRLMLSTPSLMDITSQIIYDGHQPTNPEQKYDCFIDLQCEVLNLLPYLIGESPTHDWEWKTFIIRSLYHNHNRIAASASTSLLAIANTRPLTVPLLLVSLLEEMLNVSPLEVRSYYALLGHIAMLLEIWAADIDTSTTGNQAFGAEKRDIAAASSDTKGNVQSGKAGTLREQLREDDSLADLRVLAAADACSLTHLCHNSAAIRVMATAVMRNSLRLSKAMHGPSSSSSTITGPEHRLAHIMAAGEEGIMSRAWKRVIHIKREQNRDRDFGPCASSIAMSNKNNALREGAASHGAAASVTHEGYQGPESVGNGVPVRCSLIELATSDWLDVSLQWNPKDYVAGRIPQKKSEQQRHQVGMQPGDTATWWTFCLIEIGYLMASSAVSLQHNRQQKQQQQKQKQQKQQDGHIPSFLPQLRLCLYSLLIRNNNASEFAGIERTWLNLNSLLMAVSARAAIVDSSRVASHRASMSPLLSGSCVESHLILEQVSDLFSDRFNAIMMEDNAFISNEVDWMLVALITRQNVSSRVQRQNQRQQRQDQAQPGHDADAGRGHAASPFRSGDTGQLDEDNMHGDDNTSGSGSNDGENDALLKSVPDEEILSARHRWRTFMTEMLSTSRDASSMIFSLGVRQESTVSFGRGGGGGGGATSSLYACDLEDADLIETDLREFLTSSTFLTSVLTEKKWEKVRSAAVYAFLGLAHWSVAATALEAIGSDATEDIDEDAIVGTKGVADLDERFNDDGEEMMMGGVLVSGASTGAGGTSKMSFATRTSVLLYLSYRTDLISILSLPTRQQQQKHQIQQQKLFSHYVRHIQRTLKRLFSGNNEGCPQVLSLNYYDLLGGDEHFTTLMPSIISVITKNNDTVRSLVKLVDFVVTCIQLAENGQACTGSSVAAGGGSVCYLDDAKHMQLFTCLWSLFIALRYCVSRNTAVDIVSQEKLAPVKKVPKAPKRGSMISMMIPTFASSTAATQRAANSTDVQENNNVDGATTHAAPAGAVDSNSSVGSAPEATGGGVPTDGTAGTSAAAAAVGSGSSGGVDDCDAPVNLEETSAVKALALRNRLSQEQRDQMIILLENIGRTLSSMLRLRYGPSMRLVSLQRPEILRIYMDIQNEGHAHTMSALLAMDGPGRQSMVQLFLYGSLHLESGRAVSTSTTDTHQPRRPRRQAHAWPMMTGAGGGLVNQPARTHEHQHRKNNVGTSASTADGVAGLPRHLFCNTGEKTRSLYYAALGDYFGLGFEQLKQLGVRVAGGAQSHAADATDDGAADMQTTQTATMRYSYGSDVGSGYVNQVTRYGTKVIAIALLNLFDGCQRPVSHAYGGARNTGMDARGYREDTGMRQVSLKILEDLVPVCAYLFPKETRALSSAAISSQASRADGSGGPTDTATAFAHGQPKMSHASISSVFKGVALDDSMYLSAVVQDIVQNLSVSAVVSVIRSVVQTTLGLYMDNMDRVSWTLRILNEWAKGTDLEELYQELHHVTSGNNSSVSSSTRTSKGMAVEGYESCAFTGLLDDVFRMTVAACEKWEKDALSFQEMLLQMWKNVPKTSKSQYQQQQQQYVRGYENGHTTHDSVIGARAGADHGEKSFGRLLDYFLSKKNRNSSLRESQLLDELILQLYKMQPEYTINHCMTILFGKLECASGMDSEHPPPLTHSNLQHHRRSSRNSPGGIAGKQQKAKNQFEERIVQASMTAATYEEILPGTGNLNLHSSTSNTLHGQRGGNGNGSTAEYHQSLSIEMSEESFFLCNNILKLLSMMISSSEFIDSRSYEKCMSELVVITMLFVDTSDEDLNDVKSDLRPSITRFHAACREVMCALLATIINLLRTVSRNTSNIYESNRADSLVETVKEFIDTIRRAHIQEDVLLWKRNLMAMVMSMITVQEKRQHQLELQQQKQQLEEPLIDLGSFVSVYIECTCIINSLALLSTPVAATRCPPSKDECSRAISGEVMKWITCGPNFVTTTRALQLYQHSIGSNCDNRATHALLQMILASLIQGKDLRHATGGVSKLGSFYSLLISHTLSALIGFARASSSCQMQLFWTGYYMMHIDNSNTYAQALLLLDESLSTDAHVLELHDLAASPDLHGSDDDDDHEAAGGAGAGAGAMMRSRMFWDHCDRASFRGFWSVLDKGFSDNDTSLVTARLMLIVSTIPTLFASVRSNTGEPELDFSLVVIPIISVLAMYVDLDKSNRLDESSQHFQHILNTSLFLIETCYERTRNQLAKLSSSSSSSSSNHGAGAGADAQTKKKSKNKSKPFGGPTAFGTKDLVGKIDFWKDMRTITNVYRQNSVYASNPTQIFRDAIGAMTEHLSENVLKEQSEFLNYLSFRGPSELAAPVSAFINTLLSTKGLSVKTLHPFRYYIISHQEELCKSGYQTDIGAFRSGTRGAIESLLASGSFESDNLSDNADSSSIGDERLSQRKFSIFASALKEVEDQTGGFGSAFSSSSSSLAYAYNGTRTCMQLLADVILEDMVQEEDEGDDGDLTKRGAPEGGTSDASAALVLDKAPRTHEMHQMEVPALQISSADADKDGPRKKRETLIDFQTVMDVQRHDTATSPIVLKERIPSTSAKTHARESPPPPPLENGRVDTQRDMLVVDDSELSDTTASSDVSSDTTSDASSDTDEGSESAFSDSEYDGSSYAGSVSDSSDEDEIDM